MKRRRTISPRPARRADPCAHRMRRGVLRRSQACLLHNVPREGVAAVLSVPTAAGSFCQRIQAISGVFLILPCALSSRATSPGNSRVPGILSALPILRVSAPVEVWSQVAPGQRNAPDLRLAFVKVNGRTAGCSRVALEPECLLPVRSGLPVRRLGCSDSGLAGVGGGPGPGSTGPGGRLH